MLHVHLLEDNDPEWLKRLTTLLDGNTDLTAGSDLPKQPTYRILIAGVPEKEHIEASPELQTLVIPWAGLPRATRELMLGYPQIAVHNIHHNALPTAEMAVNLMLCAAKDTVGIDRKLRHGDWTPRYESSNAITLSGKRCLILGYGGIGRHIAAVCLALQMQVQVIKRNASNKEDSEVTFHDPSRLHDVLPETDVLHIALPWTPETDGLIGGKELALLPRGAVLVNIARGRIIEEEALYEALTAGKLKAGLDVWYNYPQDESERHQTYPADHPFHELNNVIMTPHLAGHTSETEEHRIHHLADLLNRAARGETLPNRVDVLRGY